jgi:replication factor C small subunit
MFIEKYRPTKFKNVVGLNESIEKLINKDMPHFLFLGPAGTGKTTTAKIIIKKLGADVLRLNGSEERGIDTMRSKVKEFAMTHSSNSNFKIVFIDEADYITKEGQAILRNLMETYYKNCRFIMTANYGNKILDPIKSRCQLYEFKVPGKDDCVKRLKIICTYENIEVEDNVLLKVVEKFYPDIRSMINKVEELGEKGNISMDMIEIDVEKVKTLFNHLKEKDFLNARLWCLNSCEEPSYIMNSLFKYILKSDLDNMKKIKLVEAIAESEFRLGLSVDKEVQLSGAIVRIMNSI